MAVLQIKFKVVSNIKLHENIRVLTVESNQDFNFLAGQYFSFKIADKVNRSYSIASAPKNKRLEFLVEIIPGGVGSMFIDKLVPGDEFDALGPLGFFNLTNTDAESNEDLLIFAGTGTGVAPMRSMIIHLLKEENSKRPIKLYFGMRYEDQTYYFDEFEALAKKHPNFDFNPVISRPVIWDGLTGHVQDYIMKDSVDEKAKVYVCGSNNSVQGISTDLMNHGYKKEQIFFEKFG